MYDMLCRLLITSRTANLLTETSDYLKQKKNNFFFRSLTETSDYLKQKHFFQIILFRILCRYLLNCFQSKQFEQCTRLVIGELNEIQNFIPNMQLFFLFLYFA